MIGFEYGLCTTQVIKGEFKFMELLFLPKRGVHKIKIIDSEETYDFGPALTAETAQELERTAISFNDEEERVVGLKGTWKYNGLTSLGLITLDIDCKPEGGEYVPKGSPPFEQEIIYVEVPVMLPVPEPEIVIREKAVPVIQKETENNMMLLVIIASAAIVLIIILNIIFCSCCLRQQKRRILVLETEKEKIKVNWSKL